MVDDYALSSDMLFVDDELEEDDGSVGFGRIQLFFELLLNGSWIFRWLSIRYVGVISSYGFFHKRPYHH